jgi:L-ribulose-5-phosphate 3-epimerase
VPSVNGIGIMQGRVFPECLDRLQIFPVSRWDLELAEISLLGFDCVELLYDRQLYCQRLCLDSKDARLLWSEQRSRKGCPFARSMCVDYLASVSALDSRERFFRALGELISSVAGAGLETLIIPFCDGNEISDRRSLEIVLQCLQETGIIHRAMNCNLSLALEIPLPASEILAAFSGFGSLKFRVCLDLGNVRAMGLKPEEEIRKLGDRIGHVHIKDRSVGGPNVLLGDGDVDFEESFRALQAVGYRGPLVLETAYFTDPRAEALKNLGFVNAVLRAVAS